MTRSTMIYSVSFAMLLALFFFPFAREARAETRYVSVDGSDSNVGSVQLPWKTFAHAMKVIQGGDTLIVRNGTYRQSLAVTVSGTRTKPITIRAENDGDAIIDGEHSRVPCSVSGVNSLKTAHVVVEGIVCLNSNASTFNVSYAAEVQLRRISAYNAGPGNNHVYSIYHADHLLLEDCAASGAGRVMYDIYESDNVTLRRCWGRWVSHSGGGGPNYIVQIYGSNCSLIENCIGTMDENSNAPVSGIGVWANIHNESADRNRAVGNIVYGLSSWGYIVSSARHCINGNRFINDASIDNRYGFFQRADSDLKVDRLTIVNAAREAVDVAESDNMPKYGDFEMNGDLRNSILMAGNIGVRVEKTPRLVNFEHEYNLVVDFKHPYSGDALQGTGEKNIKVGFDVLKYGVGAYLAGPVSPDVMKEAKDGAAVGANILYRYHNGRLTGTPLWPWPMEKRIFGETGRSVTWEECGGLWKALPY